MTGLADRAFAAAFKHIFTFSLLYEDSEVDNRVLGLDSRSRVLAVSGAGCGVAGLLAAHPAHIDAIDTNRHHLALAALKVAAARRVRSHAEFYQLLGRGRHGDPERTLRPLMTRPAGLGGALLAREPPPLSAQPVRGGTGRHLPAVAPAAGGAGRGLPARPATAPAGRSSRAPCPRSSPRSSARGRRARWSTRRCSSSASASTSSSGSATSGPTAAATMMDVVTARFERLAQTDLETNWFVWVALTGEFNHDHPDAVPPTSERKAIGGRWWRRRGWVSTATSLQRMLADATPGAVVPLLPV